MCEHPEWQIQTAFRGSVGQGPHQRSGEPRGRDYPIRASARRSSPPQCTASSVRRTASSMSQIGAAIASRCSVRPAIPDGTACPSGNRRLGERLQPAVFARRGAEPAVTSSTARTSAYGSCAGKIWPFSIASADPDVRRASSSGRTSSRSTPRAACTTGEAANGRRMQRWILKGTKPASSVKPPVQER